MSPHVKYNEPRFMKACENAKKDNIQFINGPIEVDGQIHFTTSSTKPGVTHDVIRTGNVLRCNCVHGLNFPNKPCKHTACVTMALMEQSLANEIADEEDTLWAEKAKRDAAKFTREAAISAREEAAQLEADYQSLVAEMHEAIERANNANQFAKDAALLAEHLEHEAKRLETEIARENYTPILTASQGQKLYRSARR